MNASVDSKRSTLSTSKEFKWSSLFKKIKTSSIKNSQGSAMIDFVDTDVYCFKVKSLYRDEFEKIKKICIDNFDVRLEYNSQFNIILFHEISYNIDILKYNPETDGDINDKNFCLKLDNGYCLDDFPKQTKDCYHFLRTKLNITEEGIYKLHYLTF